MPKVNNKKKIIEVACRLMGEHGYHGTSLQAIADGVGITKSTIFHHFKNKEAILLAILEDAILEATYKLMLLVNDKIMSGRDKLKKFVEMQMQIVAQDGNMLNIYLGEAKHLGDNNKKIYMHGRKKYANLLKEIVIQIQNESDNRYKGKNATIITNAVLGVCNWGTSWYKKDGRMSLDEIYEQLFNVVDPKRF